MLEQKYILLGMLSRRQVILKFILELLRLVQMHPCAIYTFVSIMYEKGLYAI